MIIAMITVRMMQVPVYKIIRVVSVRDCLMPAVWPMLVGRGMRLAFMPFGTVSWVFARDFDRVFVDMPFVRVMQMAVMQVVDMSFMPHGGVAAGLPMLMSMLIVNLVICHGDVLFEKLG